MSGRTVFAPYFGTTLELLDETHPPGGERALAAFIARDAAARASDTAHVDAYQRDEAARAVANGEPPVPLLPPEQIWSAVEAKTIEVRAGRDDDSAWYVIAEGDCDWEPEHGLMMVWRDGIALCKVGPYDGHVTNAEAYDDPALVGIVYAAHDPRWTTREAR